MDAPALYDSTRRRVTGLVRDLTEEQLSTVVPACPAWTVRQLLGHMVGAPSDIFGGRLGDVPMEQWTMRQVTEREQLAVDELLSTWEQETPRWMEAMEGDDRFRPVLVVDVFTHEHDIRGALGLPPASEPEAADALDLVVQTLTGWVDQSLRAADDMPAVRLRTADSEWVLGSGEPAATVSMPSAFEVARALGGRRSRRQLESYEWEGDRSKLVDALPMLPMAADDQPL